jgi:CheY-like chemotaxis protein
LAGAVGYVHKPATAAELRVVVESILGDPSRRNRILVVDDDPDVREIYRAFMDPPFVVVTAGNGKDALELLRSQRIDLAIIDVHMPVMNGVELVRAMRAEPALEQIPVVVQSSDRTLLDAPIWGTLHVARVMDKMTFVHWVEEQIGTAM